jgi:hypothetical protein
MLVNVGFMWLRRFVMKSDLEMWPYWKEKKGIERAIEIQYPELDKNDAKLRWLLNSLRLAELEIDLHFEKLMEEEN